MVFQYLQVRFCSSIFLSMHILAMFGYQKEFRGNIGLRKQSIKKIVLYAYLYALTVSILISRVSCHFYIFIIIINISMIGFIYIQP